MCNGVRWRQTMDLMKENSILQMVEIGPSNVLGGLGKRHFKDVKISQVSSADQIKY
jgi:[acyl-carrier-protein] S-malonyltransferase